MKTRLSGAFLLLASVCLFAVALSVTQRDTATACWVVSAILFIAAAMLLLGTILGSSTVTAGDPRHKQRR